MFASGFRLSMFLLLLSGLVVCGAFLLEKPIYLLMLSSLTVLGAASFALPRTHGPILLTAYLFGTGFYSAARTIGWSGNNRDQLAWIGAQMLLSLAAASVWMIAAGFKTWRQETIGLRAQVEKLTKVDDRSSLLTFSEFMEKARYLYQDTKRRNERAFYVIVALRRGVPRYQRDLCYRQLAAMWLQTARSQYDLIGRLGRNRIVILLANIDEAGVGRVLDRFFSRLESAGWPPRSDFSVETAEMSHSRWDDFESEMFLYERGRT